MGSKMATWEEHCAADTCVSAGDATLQMAIFRLNPKGSGAFGRLMCRVLQQAERLASSRSFHSAKIARVLPETITDDTP
jgi:hypothetical protein